MKNPVAYDFAASGAVWDPVRRVLIRQSHFTAQQAYTGALQASYYLARRGEDPEAANAFIRASLAARGVTRVPEERATCAAT